MILRARALLLGVLVVVLAIIASHGAVYAALIRLLGAAERIIAEHVILGAVVFVLLSALAAMLAFISSAVLVPAAVYVWGTPVTALLLWAGWILGGVCAYTIGRHLGQPVVARLASRQTLARYQDRLSKRTPLGLVFLFQLALPSEIPGYVLGMTNYPMTRYLLALAVAELPYVVATVFLGEGLVQRSMTLLLAVGAAAILLSFVAWRVLQRRLLPKM